MDPVVFLDIDGVLMTGRSMRLPGERRFDAEALASLAWLVFEAHARIVVSSSWRQRTGRNKVRATEKALRSRGLELPIHDITPDLTSKAGLIYRAVPRGNEIEAWLQQEEAHRGRRPPFVILDDDDDMGELLPFLVQTSFEQGLTSELAALALEILGRQVLAA